MVEKQRVGEVIEGSVWVNDWRKCKLVDKMLVGDGLDNPPYGCPYEFEHKVAETLHAR